MIVAYVDNTMIAAETDEEIDKIIKMFEEEFELKIVGTLKDNALKNDIIGLNVAYDRAKGVATLSLESYIRRIAPEYPHLIDMREKMPHKSKYTFHPGRHIDDEKEIKNNTKYLQRLIGKITYI